MRLSEPERRLMIAHEREHLAAHDGRAVTMALCAIALMPWNVALWQLVRRLRLAVELDCDSRVLRATPDVKQYGVLLLEVARHTPTGSAMVAALVERPSALRRRIEAMTARGRASLGRVLRDVSGITFARRGSSASSHRLGLERLQRHLDRSPGNAHLSRSGSAPPSACRRPLGDRRKGRSWFQLRRLVTVAAADIAVRGGQHSAARVDPNDASSRGVVSALDGTPIENVPVMAVDQLSGVMISSRTNADGRYTLSIANGDGTTPVTAFRPRRRISRYDHRGQAQCARAGPGGQRHADQEQCDVRGCKPVSRDAHRGL